MAAHSVKIGIVGMGAAGQAFIPAIRKHPGFEWVALADTVAGTRQALAGQYGELGVRAYASLTELLAHPGLDAVYVATPTELHLEHVLQVAAAGKHVLVEKPMAVTLAQGRAMTDAAERAGVLLLVGHSHSYDLPIQRMRALIASGELGHVGMVSTACYTDWMYRPRRPEELDVELGGGTLFRQGAHQFDILRLLCGGRARSVRAKAFDWDPQRRAIGAHMAFLEFDNGAAASAVYNGYGGLSSMDLCFDISEWGFHQPAAARPKAQRAVSGASEAVELRAKQARARHAIPAQAPFQPFFGLTVASCERGDIRQSPTGLLVCTAEGQREIALPNDQSPRDLVLAEFFDAIIRGKPALHDGRWGLATLEVCVAALESSRTGRDVLLHEQVDVPP